MRIVVTGAAGFIGSNLRVRLREAGHTDVIAVTREFSVEQTADALSGADFVFHLAGVNRPKNASEFTTGNTQATEQLCRALAATGRCVPVVFASSTQAT
jgi:UDP-2-acetamido-2,6-beta-L-arabino-hexul-4-ose reductase